jgi:hypothetical protein
MATGNMVPYSNPAGNNQTTPGAGMPVAKTATTPLPGTATTTPASGATVANPLVPAATATATAPGATPTSSTVPSASTTGSGAEINNIFGAGVGGDINSFLSSISGADSAALQEFIKSLQPQEANAQAQTNAALGAGGVGANSSVAALADANLGSQEFAAISGEEAQLTQSGLQMQEQMIQGMEAPAENYTAEQNMMPWEIGGALIGAAGSVASAAIPRTTNIV